ncbi:hypothetical protein [Oerskovia jenensis]|uniref:hypothetical protein n=1 Tax=Oerskovia jenensis TaxID=162169 RepID=UPI0036DD72A3
MEGLDLRVSRGPSWVVVAALVALGGCSTAPSESEGPFAAEFAQARNQATTDFEREVLEDDEIAEAELDEARQRFERCVEDLGYLVTFGEHGMRIEYPGVDASNAAETEAASEKAFECEVGSTSVIEPLYAAVRSNPEGGDYRQNAVECLIRHGVAPESARAEDLESYTVSNADSNGPSEEIRATVIACLDDTSF